MKTFIMLENNPSIMNDLAAALGLAPTLTFHDIYSLTDPSLLALVPRPTLALLAIIPMTPAWRALRATEDAVHPTYAGCGPSEPVLWFRQTIGHACGSIGLLHCLLNLPADTAATAIPPHTTLASLRHAAIPARPAERAQILYDSDAFEVAHMAAARRGDTAALDPSVETGMHFVAFVRGRDGHLWEMEGGRKGPLDRGMLGDGEDLLGAEAVGMGLGRYMRLAEEAGDGELRFSVLALTAATAGSDG